MKRFAKVYALGAAFLILLFLVFRVAGPRLVSAHNTPDLWFAAGLILLVPLAALWFAIEIWRVARKPSKD